MSDILEIHEFFVEGGSEKKSHVLLHISEPGTPEEKQKGYFFAVAEIRNGAFHEIKQLQDLIDEAETRYFGAKDSGQSSFESVIESLNRRGHRLLAREDIDVHCLIGVLRGRDISFASYGTPQAAVLYERNGAIECMDLGEHRDSDPAQLFSSLVSGTLGTNDYFYAATPKVREFFPDDRIKKLVVGRTTAEMADHMEKVLGNLRDASSYGGVFFHIIPRHEAPRTGPQPIPVAEKEASLLSSQSNQHSRARVVSRKNSERFMPAIGRASIAGLSLLLRLLRHIGIFIGRSCITGIILLTNKGGQRAIVLRDTREWFDQKRRRFAELSIVSKILLCIAVLSAGVFVGSMGYLRYKAVREERMASYLNQIQAIKDKKDAAEASSIYGDDARAFQLLKEAEDLLAVLPKEGRATGTVTAELQTDITRLLHKLQRWETIASESILQLTEAGGAAVTDLAHLDGFLLAHGPESARLIMTHPDTRTQESVSHDAFAKLRAGATPKEEDTVIFAFDAKDVAAYDKTAKKITDLDISFPQEESIIQSLFVYNQRLFTLDPNTNQIYRHAKTQTGYERGSPWVKSAESIDIRTAVSLAIDGDIYVLTATDILLFRSGSPQAFTIQNLDPALDRPAKIWTYNGVPYLYVLEPTNKRLIVLDKSGVLVAQYTDPAWKHPTGMVIDAEKNLAYVLDSNIVYRFSVE